MAEDTSKTQKPKTTHTTADQKPADAQATPQNDSPDKAISHSATQCGETTPDIVIITGMSGAGRTETMHTFEDLGYYVIDNLPPELIIKMAEIVGINSGVGRHLAVVCDLRSQGLFEDLLAVLDELEAHELSYSLLFLDSGDEVLRRRYSQLRRRHPIALDGESVAQAIERERKQLAKVRAAADFVVDTSHLRPAQLRKKLHSYYSNLSAQQMLDVRVFSLGFKYGMPVEADLLIDVRFLPNPYYDPEMRTMTGMDDPVYNFVMEHSETQKFLSAWFALLDTAMPGYVAEGKAQLSIGIACTGGQHRSVSIARATAEYLEKQGYHVTLTHRDLARAEK